MTSVSAAQHAPAAYELTPAAEAMVFRGPGRPFERVSVPEVTLAVGEAIVEIELATICAVDERAVGSAGRVQSPVVLGHEQVGRIVALGPGRPARAVDGAALSVGDRVVWSPSVACGQCRACRRGQSVRCEHRREYGRERMRRGWELSGGFATHTHLLARTTIVRVSEGLPAAALAPASCATATAVAALAAAEMTRPLAGELLVVSGCDLTGLTTIAAAVEAGATVVAIDSDAERRALAREFGAAAVADSGHDELAMAMRNARGRRSRPDGFTIAVDTSGSAPAIELLLRTAGVGAAIVLVNQVDAARAVRLSAERVVHDQLTVTGVRGSRPEHMERAVRFLETTDVELLASLVVDIVSLGDLASELRNPSDRGLRVGVDPRR